MARHERSLDLLRWGLIPRWAKDINVGLAAEGTAAWSRSRTGVLPPRHRRQLVHDEFEIIADDGEAGH